MSPRVSTALVPTAVLLISSLFGIGILRHHEAAWLQKIRPWLGVADAQQVAETGEQQESSETRYWLERAASCGDSEAALELARLELEPRTRGAEALAERWLEKAKDRDDAAFATKAGELILDHSFSACWGDFERAEKWLTKGMSGGDRTAAVRLGRLFEVGGRDARRAFDAVQRTSDDDWLGRIAYRGGENLTPDHTLASKLFLSAASRGDSRAAVTLAEMLNAGDGVKKNTGEATAWLLRSAGASNRDALLDLILLRKDRELPQSVRATTTFDEVRQFARNGQPFHAKPPGRSVSVINGSFSGIIHFYPDRIEIGVDQATVEHPGFANAEPDELESIRVQLIRAEAVSCGIPWTIDAESQPIAVHRTSKGSDKYQYALPTPLRFTIQRNAITGFDRHWLVFALDDADPRSQVVEYTSHMDRYLLSTEVR